MIKKLSPILYCSLLILVLYTISGCSLDKLDNSESSYDNVKDEDTRYNEILKEVDNYSWSDSCISEDGTWLIYYAKDGESLQIVKMNDKEIIAERSLGFKEYCGINCAFISMIDDEVGYILCCGDPALSQMLKYLFKTTDGWKTYEMVADLSWEVHNYPTDMEFSDENSGVITVDYHGTPVYAYHTEDGGDAWSEIIVDDFKDDYFYIVGEKIQWKNGQWILSVSGVQENGKVSLDYLSADCKEWVLRKEE